MTPPPLHHLSLAAGTITMITCLPTFAIAFLPPPPPLRTQTMGCPKSHGFASFEALIGGRIAATVATGMDSLDRRISTIVSTRARPGWRRRSMMTRTLVAAAGGVDDETICEEVDGPSSHAGRVDGAPTGIGGGTQSSSSPSREPPVPAKILGGGEESDDDDGGELEEDIVGITVHEDAYGHLGVSPPSTKYPRRLGRFSWRVLQRVIIPILHAFDPLKPPGKFINVECIWCKVISTNDPKSPTYDHGVTYDVLPPVTRIVVSPTVVRCLGRFVFPRWVHPLFELRTAYLDVAIAGEVERVSAADDDRNRRHRSRGRRDDDDGGGGCLENDSREEENDDRTKIRIVSFGAGYDARCIRLAERDDVNIDEYYELDLPEVVDAKRGMMGRERLLGRRQRRGLSDLTECDLPVLIGVDLNDVDHVRSILDDIVAGGGGDGDGVDGDCDGDDVDGSGTGATTVRRCGGRASRWHTIFVFEGVLMYLREGVAGEVLGACSASVRSVSIHHRAADGEAGPASSKTATGSLCFADRIEDVPGVDVRRCRSELRRHGWDLVDWTPNARANARHMGTARCSSVVGRRRSMTNEAPM